MRTDKVSQARKLFVRAERLMQDQRPKKALRLYERAYRLAPRAAFLFNIAQCHRLLGHHEQALAYYGRFLREGKPKGELRGEVERLIRQAQQALGQAPGARAPGAEAKKGAGAEVNKGAGAEVKKGPVPEAAKTPVPEAAKTPVPGQTAGAGKSTAAAAEPVSRTPRARTAAVLKGSGEPWSRPTAAVREGSGGPSSRPTAIRGGDRLRRRLLWSGVGVTAALLTAGLVAGQVASNQSAEFRQPGTSAGRRESLDSSAEALSVTSVAMFVVAAATGVATAWYWLVGGESAARRPSAAPVRGGAVVGWSGGF